MAKHTSAGESRKGPPKIGPCEKEDVNLSLKLFSSIAGTSMENVAWLHTPAGRNKTEKGVFRCFYGQGGLNITERKTRQNKTKKNIKREQFVAFHLGNYSGVCR